MKVTRSAVKAKLLTFFLRNCKAHATGPSRSCCMVHIFPVRGSAHGFGKGEEDEKSKQNIQM